MFDWHGTGTGTGGGGGQRSGTPWQPLNGGSHKNPVFGIPENKTPPRDQICLRPGAPLAKFRRGSREIALLLQPIEFIRLPASPRPVGGELIKHKKMLFSN